MTRDIEERPRGFLTQADREFLATPEEDLDVQNQTKWKRRRKIRERTYNAILDFHFLEDIDYQLREQIFDDIQENWMDDAHAFRAMFEFVYLGLLELGLAEGFPPLIERAVLNAMVEHNQTHGEYLHINPDVEIAIEHRFDSEEPEEPKDYDRSLYEEMFLDQFDDTVEGMDTAEHIRREYQAMAAAGVLDSEERHPDEEREGEAVELLRDFCEKNDITNLAAFWRFVEDVPDDHTIHTLLETLRTVTVPLKIDRPETPEEVLESFTPSTYEEYKDSLRPRGVENWDPSSDPALEEMIAYEEATGGLMTEDKFWDRLKEEVGFDPDQWDYEAIREDPFGALWGDL